MTDPEQTYLTQHAAALVCAVADRDEVGVMDAFRGLSPRQLRDLAVWLARHVNPDVPFAPRILSHELAVEDCIRLTAKRYGTTPAVLKSTSRRRDHINIRHVAAYAARLCGGSFPQIGRALSRDHSTIMHSVGRVGEDARLRAAAHEIAAMVGRVAVDDDVEVIDPAAVA